MYQESDHTFVVCAYGESPYLEDCVQSLLAQTRPTNILVATATPNDHIRDIASRHDLPLHVNPSQPGIGSDWNYAISRATTPLVTVAHQDDIYLPHYAERALQLMGQAERPLIFFTDYAELRGDEVVADNRLLQIKRLLLTPLRKVGSSSSRKVKRQIISLGSAICCPSVTLNMDLLPNPPFSQTLRCDLDWDAWERFSRMTGSFVLANEILMYHRIHEESETTRLIRDNTRTAEDLMMLERFWPKPVAQLVNVYYSRGQKSNG